MDFKATVEHRVRDGSYIDPDKGAVTVNAYWAEFCGRRQVKDTTAYRDEKSYIRHLKPSIGHKPLGNVVAADLERIAHTMTTGGLTAATFWAVANSLKAMFRQAVKDKAIAHSPFASAVLPKLPPKMVDETELPTFPDIDRIARGMKPQNAVGIWLMAGCGLRIGEAMGVREGDFRLVGGTRVLRVRRQVQKVRSTDGKLRPALVALKHRQEGEWRDVPVPGIVWDHVQWHVRRFGTAEDGRLLRTSTGDLMTPDWYREDWYKAVPRVGTGPTLASTARWSPHALRRYFATTCLLNGLPLLSVSRWLGHGSITETADTYGHLTPDAVDTAVSVLDLAMVA
ncbi:tyrosine-type recombinase/integrase [Streptomyces sp. TRM66268-LWL]|uniref:Tyrosine-type recombinase/integrase n=1 Tax=Streptomyces polyasparticus TaxID=2767826 RepID=A0ABR7SBX0_9ACTN|nr:tyrosine-type recombinase/integrase [Streptomyces polyasparticus]MBC9712240.1 tyrosine-type recombinase/integrase [Streptomyces polyasparticus]